MRDQLRVDVSYKQILRIALPISFALMVPQLNFVINNIFLGHFSSEALAAASITGVYYLIFAGIGYGLNNGLQALISRRAGEERPDAIGTVFNQGVLLSIVVAAVGILLTYLLSPLIFAFSLHDDQIRSDAVSFLKIRIWGLPFLYVYQMRNALLVGINRTRLLVFGTLAETLANVLFDYAFIFGHFGFPALGFIGAAYASVIAEFMGMITIFGIIHFNGISKRYALFRSLRFEKTVIRSILNISLPLVLQHAISIMSWLFFYMLVEHHGRIPLAVSNTMRNVFGFFGVFVWALAATTNSMVSNVIGQGRQNEVMFLMKKIMTLSFGLAMIVCVILNLFPQTILSIYGQDAAFLETAIPVARVVSGAMLLMSFGSVWLNAVTATGNTRITLGVEVASLVFYLTYVYLVLEVFRLSIAWGWLSEVLYWGVTFTLSFMYLRSHKWKEKII